MAQQAVAQHAISIRLACKAKHLALVKPATAIKPNSAMTMHSLLNSSLNSLRKIPIGALVCASRIYGMLRVAAGITSGFTAFTVSWH
jgi:hypothetical protein